MADNPYEPSNTNVVTNESNAEEIGSGRAAYNVISDTVTGVNVRGSDNMFQAKFVAASVVLLAAVGSILALLITSWRLPWYGGAMIGAFAGLVIGVLVSGIILMIYRAKRHLRGEHD